MRLKLSSGCSEIVFRREREKRRYINISSTQRISKCTLSRQEKDLAEQLKKIPELAVFYYTLQEKPMGLGHAVLCAEEFCRNEYFGLLLPDDVMLADPTVPSQPESVRKEYGGSVLSLEEVDREDTSEVWDRRW